MVQIIQSGPSSSTIRQQALDQAIGNIIGGVGKYQDQQLAEQATKRQQALDMLNTTAKLRDQGFDVTPEQVGQVLAPAPQASFIDKITRTAAPEAPRSFGDIFSKRTPEYEQKMRDQEEERILRRQQISGQGEERRFQREKFQQEMGLKERELGLKQAELTDPRAKLNKLGGETQSKVGGIAEALKSLTEIRSAINSGLQPSRLDANTPVIGTLFSDNPLTSSQRVLDDVIGRLQSGGAIGETEVKTFRSMGPRPGDSPEEIKNKLSKQESFLSNKLNAFGFKKQDLENLGFDVGQNVNTMATTPSNQTPGIDTAQAGGSPWSKYGKSK